jgi:hypothetical protein
MSVSTNKKNIIKLILKLKIHKKKKSIFFLPGNQRKQKLRDREKEITFLPAILLERLPIETGGNVEIFLS